MYQNELIPKNQSKRLDHSANYSTLPNRNITIRNGRWEIPIELLGQLAPRMDKSISREDNIIVCVSASGYTEVGISKTRPTLYAKADIINYANEVKEESTVQSCRKELNKIQDRELGLKRSEGPLTGANAIPIVNPRKFGIDHENLPIESKYHCIQKQLESKSSEIVKIATRILEHYSSLRYPEDIPRFIYNRMSHACQPLTVDELLFKGEYLKRLSKIDLYKVANLFKNSIIYEFAEIFDAETYILLPSVGTVAYINKAKTKVNQMTSVDYQIRNMILNKRELGKKEILPFEYSRNYFMRIAFAQGKSMDNLLAKFSKAIYDEKEVRSTNIIANDAILEPIKQKPKRMSRTVNKLIMDYDIKLGLKDKFKELCDKFQHEEFQLLLLQHIDDCIPNRVKDRNVFEHFESNKDLFEIRPPINMSAEIVSETEIERLKYDPYDVGKRTPSHYINIDIYGSNNN